MAYVMKRVMLKDKHGNQRYEPSVFVEHNGQSLEFSGLPMYIYMPVKEDCNERGTRNRQLDEDRDVGIRQE